MLSEEEKKAIEECKMSLEVFRFSGISEKDKVLLKAKDLKILLNLTEEQQAEIKQLKEDISNMFDEKVVRNILEDECGLSKFEIDEILN